MRTALRLALFAAFFLFTTFTTAAPLTLVKDGRSDYQILLPAAASPSEQRGATELQTHLEKMTGAKLPIVSDANPLPPHAILVGNTKYTPDLVKSPSPDPGPEGFRLRAAGRHLVIAGSDVRGAMYGCTALLEKLGVRWYTADVAYTPYRKTLTLDDQLDETSIPAFEYREVYIGEALASTDFAARLRLNGHHHPLTPATGGRIRYSRFAHTFDAIDPPTDGFRQHPDLFPLIKGKRTGGYVQRCLSNPEFLKLTIARVREWIAANPDALIHSVTQNDTYKWCECDDCTAIAKQYGGVQSGLYIWFVNQVAQEIEKTNPDVLIDTFAYQFTEAPPTGIKPRKNVRVRLCPIAACAAHPFEQCTYPATVAFLKHLDGWSKITDTLYIWHYNTCFTHYLMPYPDFGEFPADTRLYKGKGVRGVFFEGDYAPGGGGSFADLQTYVMSKLLWDPSQKEDALVQEWHTGVYAQAAPPMLEWFKLLHAKAADPKHHFVCFSNPGKVAYLTPDVIAKGDELFARALALSADNPVATGYVEKARLGLRYTKLFQNPTTGPEFDSLMEDLRRMKIRQIREHVSLDAWEKDFRQKHK
jgi:hypothetical protein